MWAGGYSCLQILLAVANTIAGFLLIRILDKPNYAWFTVAFAGQSIMLILADSGLSSALTFLGGPLNSNRPKLSKLYELIRIRRQVLSSIALLVVLPLSGWMLIKNDAGIAESILILSLLGISGWASVINSLLLAVCRLTKDLNVVFKSESLGAFGRLICYLPLFATGSNAVIVLAVTTILQCLQLWILSRSTSLILGPPGQVDENWQPEMARSMRQVLPITIWYCIQGQLQTLILSMSASVGEVADIGALGRFAALFTLAYMPIGHYFLPALARSIDPVALKRHMALGMIAFGSVLALICAGGFLLSEKILVLLGPQYLHLDKELVLFLCGLAITMFAQMIWGINFARGWTHFAWIYIPITIVLQIGMLWFVDIHTVFGVVQLGVACGVASLGTAGWLTLCGLKKYQGRTIELENKIVIAK